MIAELRAKLTSKQKEIDELKQTLKATTETRTPVRIFFTEGYHNEGEERFWTLKYWFGLTNSFPDMVEFVKAFHHEDALKVEHSNNKRPEPLTPFEQCMAAKS